ncbi:E3 SUMO-protein ligase KIAA1586 [Dissostichus eleginoides]|uniref:E3 SUMO-protein ligase KIAA1586 n=1 Tax=Dissostichus eleginoides TaxID=100907 RepID=A0AAD9F0Y6_DISEL|nr:E3 SUMO-protein ligase KIAA1586 [Dissostichus eleginoides]
MSKRKLNQSVSLAHFGFTSKKVTPRDDQETPRDDADDAAASTALATRTVSESGAPVPPSHSPEGGEVEAERSEDAAVAEVAATAASDFPPAGWTTKQVGEWKDRNPWLEIKAGKLGCLVCRKAKTLLLSEKGPGLHLSEEWINGDVTSPDAKQLRKKIYKHRDSQAHARSVEIVQMKDKETLPNCFIDVQSDLLKKTTVSFRTAYTVAKERLSYKKLNPLMTMQELNGAEVGNIHKSDHACAEIISHIAKEMRRKFVSNVKEMDSKVSITIDESTVHGRPYLIIYVRCDVSGKGDVDNVFLDIVELTDGVDAESIYNSMMAIYIKLEWMMTF